MILDIDNIEFSRETLTLERIAAGEAQIRFGDEILPPSTLPSLNWFVGDVYQLTDLHAAWTFDEDYTVGATTCSGSGAGVLTEENAFGSTFQIGTHLRQADGSIPALYRSFYYELTLFADGQPVTGTCVSNGQTSPYSTEFLVALAGGYRNTTQFGMLLIDPSGDRINESWSVGTLDMDLDLTSEPIP